MRSDRECREDRPLQDISPPQYTDYQARSMMLLADDSSTDTSCIFLPHLTSIGLIQKSAGPSYASYDGAFHDEIQSIIGTAYSWPIIHRRMFGDLNSLSLLTPSYYI